MASPAQNRLLTRKRCRDLSDGDVGEDCRAHRRVPVGDRKKLKSMGRGGQTNTEDGYTCSK